MDFNKEYFDKLTEEYGDALYILDRKRFINNFNELKGALTDYYKKFNLSYSFKTNYTPLLCKTVLELGGYAEVVSSMEYYLAKKVGFSDEKIILNGPKKDESTVESLLTGGGQVNLDSAYELEMIKRIADRNKDKILKVALRCNFDIGDNVLSRFGFDVESQGFNDAFNYLKSISNVKLTGFHCHFAGRRLEPFTARAEKMIELIDKYYKGEVSYVSLGGGLFGKMPKSLKKQFSVPVPTYFDYADKIGKPIREYFKNKATLPDIFIEAGTAVVADAMYFLVKVLDIKKVRGKEIAIVSGSKYNINPTGNSANLPIKVYNGKNAVLRTDLDFGGFTCIESDYLYKGYTGKLAVGDYVLFENAGSYSVVLKPPFILPNFAMVEIDKEVKLVKMAESNEHVFDTFLF